MTATDIEIAEVLGELNQMAPAGYALGIHIQYTTPRFMFQTYKKEWLDYYSQNGLVMVDPMVLWGFENTGFARWSSLTDDTGVLEKAASYGMHYGIVYATDVGPTRTIGGFARSDREFTDSEAKLMGAAVDKIHLATAKQSALPPETAAQLRKMSVMVTHPGS